MVNGVGAGNCQRTVRHPSVDRCHPAQKSLCLFQDRKEGMGGEVPSVAWPCQPPTGFACAHFFPITVSPVRAIRPSAGTAPLVFLPSLSSRGGTGLQGPSCAGLLVMVVNSHDPMGCLGIAKALEIGRSPRSGCTQPLACRL